MKVPPSSAAHKAKTNSKQLQLEKVVCKCHLTNKITCTALLALFPPTCLCHALIHAFHIII